MKRLPPWRIWRWSLVLGVPLVAINLAVGFFGRSLVFPLSPFFLREKTAALGLYLLHRPRCLISGHPDLGPLVARAERQHQLPHGLLAAVIEVESNGRVHRISPAGAMGPGQLTRSTARFLGVSDPFDPAENIDGAARYLSTQWRSFHDVRLVAAAYNAGPGAVVNRQVPYNGETERYVEKVLRIMGPRGPLRPPRPADRGTGAPRAHDRGVSSASSSHASAARNDVARGDAARGDAPRRTPVPRARATK